MKTDFTYFNFPIVLMHDVLLREEKRQAFLSKILYYHIYVHSLKIEDLNEYDETAIERFERSAKYWHVSLGSVDKAYDMGESLYDGLSENKVMVGIRSVIFWQFYKEEKPEFDWLCLFAYLGLKSIIGNKTYCKTDNIMMLSRMAGIEKKTDFHGLIFTRYQLDKIKTDLQLNWGLIYYSRFTRGFYVGFDITLEDLVYEAESRKKTMKEKSLKDKKIAALEMAKKRLNQK